MDHSSISLTIVVRLTGVYVNICLRICATVVKKTDLDRKKKREKNRKIRRKRKE